MEKILTESGLKEAFIKLKKRLSKVALSNDYEDLDNKPTDIPYFTTEIVDGVEYLTLVYTLKEEG